MSTSATFGMFQMGSPAGPLKDFKDAWNFSFVPSVRTLSAFTFYSASIKIDVRYDMSPYIPFNFETYPVVVQGSKGHGENT